MSLNEIIDFNCNHPFVFVIQQYSNLETSINKFENYELLFIGKVINCL